ncbi:LEAF RUST 10 DISEASE-RESISTANCEUS RECEPTOR-LIKE PROTEIN KINASE-like 2.1 isoform X2 [Miscanthus floridulus]|uniref:LEAF RUST 10 DISEASE-RESISTANCEUS RECEPTOR-LIKE PROTEIN KINASE-like 2.1 isoform X2 n=1 Tax=Miscanthus floridulus TaxID=154761 RepID=UPI0034586350
MLSLSHHDRGLLHLLVLLLLAAAVASRGDDDTYAVSACRSRPYLCGGVNISYPFYLASDDAKAVPDHDGESYCGYPGLAIICDGANNKPVLKLGDDNYTVSGIDYANLIVSLADADAAGAGNGGCPVVDHNVTIPPAVRLSLILHSVDYLFFFVGCSFGPEAEPAPKPPKPPTIKPITCGDMDKPASMTLVLPRGEVPPGDWSSACRQIFEVPVLKSSIPPDAQDPVWRKDGYGKALRAGFQLGWDRSSGGPCGQCEQSSGKCGYNRAGEFLGCLCPDGRVGDGGSCRSKGKTAIIVGIVAGTLFLCLGILIFFSARKYAWLPLKSKDEPRIESFLQKNGNIHPKRYTYANVKRMTKSFDVKLGQGGFGAVYRGNLHDGRQVAVKMLKDTKGDGEEFMNEVASISRTSHINVVTLLGFCLQGSKRALIYEYMPNGSLERYAFNRNMNSENLLSWEKLFDIAIGTARGLEYLHRGCNTRIVHFDIKPHNILLDQDFCPKISDFGLAKLCLNKESAISIAGARGTIGYIAPEVYSKQFGLVSSKSDVYSYGMMVLEMVGARDKNTSENSESSSQYFPQWIYEHLDDYCISASEIDGETTELVRKMIVVGLWCIQVIPTDRPTMTRVVEMLEGSTSNLELPPKVLLS